MNNKTPAGRKKRRYKVMLNQKRRENNKNLLFISTVFIFSLMVIPNLVQAAYVLNPVGSYTDDAGDYSLDDVYGLVASGDFLYTISTHDHTLAVWNISAHGNPVPVGTMTDFSGINSLNYVRDLAISGDYVYTISWTGDNLAVWNISAHGNPVFLGGVVDNDGDYSMDRGSGIAVEGNYVYTVGEMDYRLAVWNVTDKSANPIPIGSVTDSDGDYSLDSSGSLAISGDYVYTVSDVDDTLAVWNISAHGNPVGVGTFTDSEGDFSLDGAADVFISGDLAYTVSQSDDTLAVWNISAHGNPVPVASYTSDTGDYSIDRAFRITELDGYIYVGTRLENIVIFQLTDDTTAPTFTDISNQTVEYGTALGYDINATDENAFDTFSVNDTTNFKINSTGYLENATTLDVGLYWLNITINDTAGNENSSLMWVNVTDTIVPNVTLNSPAANYYNGTSEPYNITFNCSATDINNLANLSLYLTNSQNSSFTLNQTMNITGTSNSSNWTLGLYNGNYTWNCLAYDSSGNSNWGNSNRSIAINFTDNDGDGVSDGEDYLEGNESNVNITGVSSLNISISGNSTSGSYNSIQEVVFYDSSDKIMNFTHNFTASELDLSRITINKADNSIIVNLSGQVQLNYNKTVYITDNNFASLCVKDSEVGSIDEFSSGCNGANETDFTSCLGGSVVLNGIPCTDEGSTIKVENLRYSAIRGTQASSSNPPSGGGSSCTSVWSCTSWSKCVNGTQNRTCTDTRCHRTYGKPAEIQNCTCKENWICGSWSDCSGDGKQTRSCNDYNKCGTTLLKPKTQQSCVYETQNETGTMNTVVSPDTDAEEMDTKMQQEEIKQETNLDTKNTKGYWVFAVILLIIGTALFFFYNKKKKHKKK